MFQNKLHRIAGGLPFFGATLLFVLLLAQWDQPSENRSVVPRVKAQFALDLAELDALVQTRFLPLAERSISSDSLQAVFRRCRMAYKKLEIFTEYYFPATTRLVNGPPLPEIEAQEGKLFEPGGLQVIEEMLYPRFDPGQRTALIREVRKLRRELLRYDDLWRDTELTDAHVFDAVRMQVFRIISLGISGFDTPSCQTAVPEAAQAMQSLRAYLRFYKNRFGTVFVRVDDLVRQAEQYLNHHPDFDTFNRAFFIKNLTNPLSVELLAFQRELGIAPFSDLRAFRADAPTPFEAGAFNPDFYAPTAQMRSNPAKVLLGKKLFFDPILSQNDSVASGQRSCASCHQPTKGFTDGLPKNATLSGRGTLLRNTPTLVNAALQSGLFYDLRADNLENQASDVIQNQEEMHGSLEKAVLTLRQNRLYQSLFRKAFPDFNDTLKPIHIQNALAAFERSLIKLDSRFDRYMRGETGPSGKPLLSAEEIAGFNLFMGKARCGTCHFLPLFNGTVPPFFSETESEVIGVPIRPGLERIDPDQGRYGRFALEPLRHAFKTPTVRHAVQTAPYMHNGAFRTLEEVIDFYDNGGGKGLGITVGNQTLSDVRLRLSRNEKSAIIAFIKSL
ncbi:cytochrome-c peroxidase [Larkinella sp. VNQ87]|uniref:cytochrome-c peroxidase n=1 Tax=Larkinella sp. VNQ87 TaxID=3400921 RepID=UPI003C0BD7D1